MLADVANLARGARGFLLIDGATRFLEPGARARLDLADHALHRAWAAAGEVAITPVDRDDLGSDRSEAMNGIDATPMRQEVLRRPVPMSRLHAPADAGAPSPAAREKPARRGRAG